MRLSREVVEWFRREQPKGYQSRINAVLEDYVQAKAEQRIRAAGRAQEIFKQYYATCFWHYDKNLKIDVDNMHLVVEGLKKYGGRIGLLLSEELCQ